MPPAIRDGRRVGEAFLKKLSRTTGRKQRLKILRACARIDEPWAEEVLWESLRDPGEDVRDYLVSVLGGRRNLNLHLARRLMFRPPWYARSSVIRILGLRKSPEVIPWIAGILGDANVDIRKCTADALGDIGGRKALSLLVGMRKDESPYVRAAAEEAIRKASPIRFS